jgi:hypothetical protein
VVVTGMLLGGAECKTKNRSNNYGVPLTSVLVEVDASAPIATTDQVFLCATLDWWPPDKCDYGTCSWGTDTILNIVNQSSPKSLLSSSSSSSGSLQIFSWATNLCRSLQNVCKSWRGSLLPPSLNHPFSIKAFASTSKSFLALLAETIGASLSNVWDHVLQFRLFCRTLQTRSWRKLSQVPPSFSSSSSFPTCPLIMYSLIFFSSFGCLALQLLCVSESFCAQAVNVFHISPNLLQQEKSYISQRIADDDNASKHGTLQNPEFTNCSKLDSLWSLQEVPDSGIWAGVATSTISLQYNSHQVANMICKRENSPIREIAMMGYC